MGGVKARRSETRPLLDASARAVYNLFVCGVFVLLRVFLSFLSANVYVCVCV